MMIFSPVKKAKILALFLLVPIFLFTFQSCKKKRSEMANVLFKKTHNKVFQDVTPEDFAVVFKKVFAQQRSGIAHAEFIINYYEQNDYEPEFVIDHVFNNDLLTVADYYDKAGEHGLNPKMFNADHIRELVQKLTAINGIKTVNEAYEDMAELELAASNSLINYSNALQYGVINPKSIYQRYFTATKRPDSASMLRIFSIDDVHAYLDSVQPKAPEYRTLQKKLAEIIKSNDTSREEEKRTLLVNLERLRWRNKPFEDKYVMVNLPDYTLNVVDSGKSVLKMKVCIGQGRNMDNVNTLVAYNDSCKTDNPNPHETPQLNSLIHSVEVNPVWNIPRSIATKEIIVEAAKDRFYLSNKNINVYQNDKLVPNPEDIDWSKVTKENSDYDFKQQPGEDNSLGKIKFLFKNKSSVYLHDTPAKGAFFKKMRAVSHGCVRLGDPQALALSLFGAGDKYDTIVLDMSQDNPNPTTIYLPKKVPVYITYVTCWLDENGILQYRPDVYGLDIVLYDHLLKYLPGKS